MKRSDNQEALDVAFRNKLTAFIAKTFQVVSPASPYMHNWHIDVIADRLTQCYTGDIKRLIINLPPRNLKSICASVAYPAWVLGQDPTRQIICVSYASELSIDLARDCKSVMESDWYRRVFSGTKLKRSKDHDLETTKKGMRYATSVHGTLTGMGGDIIIIDDPMKPEESQSETMRKKVKDWYDGTLYSRLNDKANNVIILIMQRLHVDDLVAHVLQKDDWELLNLPAIAEINQTISLSNGRVIHRQVGELLHPERESLETLNKIKHTMGEFTFSTQYQQQPIPPEGNLIKWSWFQFYENVFKLDRADHVVQSWDTASKATELANYSVCMTWLARQDKYYLLDIFREKLDFPALHKVVIQLAQRYPVKHLLIEDAASGTALIQSLRHQRPYNVPYPDAITPREDKVVRMAAQSIKIEQGRVYLPQDADFIEPFYREVLPFPNGAHDDQIDSMSQFLSWIDDRRRKRVVVTKLHGF